MNEQMDKREISILWIQPVLAVAYNGLCGCGGACQGCMSNLKGIVHPKMKIQLLSTHPHADGRAGEFF